MENKIELSNLILEEYGDMLDSKHNVGLFSFKVNNKAYICKLVEPNKRLYLVSKLVKGMGEYRHIGTDFSTLDIPSIYKDSYEKGKVKVYKYEVEDETEFGNLELTDCEVTDYYNQLQLEGKYIFN